MTMHHHEISYPVRLAANPNVPGVFYIYDAKEEEVAMTFNQPVTIVEQIVSAINASQLQQVAA